MRVFVWTEVEERMRRDYFSSRSLLSLKSSISMASTYFSLVMSFSLERLHSFLTSSSLSLSFLSLFLIISFVSERNLT